MRKNRVLKIDEKDKIVEIIKKYFPELSEYKMQEKFEEMKSFFENYLVSRRDSVSTFENNITLTFSFLSCIGFNNLEIYDIISPGFNLSEETSFTIIKSPDLKFSIIESERTKYDL